MKLRLENTDSKKTKELGDLIRSYNQSKREPSKNEPLNIYVEDEQGNLLLVWRPKLLVIGGRLSICM